MIRLSRVGCFAAVALLMLGCSVEPAATGGAVPSADIKGSEPPRPQGEDCRTLIRSNSDLPPDLAQMSADATNVLVGEFLDYGEAFWNTPGRKRPTQEEFEGTSAALVRPVTLKLQDSLRGDDSAGDRLIQRGGKSGCDIVDFADEDLSTGQRYVFFALPLLDTEMKETDRLLSLAMWPVGDGDIVHTPRDGDMTIEELGDRLRNGPPEKTPEPEVPEPEPTTPG